MLNYTFLWLAPMFFFGNLWLLEALIQALFFSLSLRFSSFHMFLSAMVNLSFVFLRPPAHSRRWRLFLIKTIKRKQQRFLFHPKTCFFSFSPSPPSLHRFAKRIQIPEKSESPVISGRVKVKHCGEERFWAFVKRNTKLIGNTGGVNTDVCATQFGGHRQGRGKRGVRAVGCRGLEVTDS